MLFFQPSDVLYTAASEINCFHSFADIKFHATVHLGMIHTSSLILWGDHNTVTLLIIQYQKKKKIKLWGRERNYLAIIVSPCLKSWVLLLVINRRYILSRLSVTILWCIILITIGLFVSAHTVSFLNKLIMGYTVFLPCPIYIDTPSAKFLLNIYTINWTKWQKKKKKKRRKKKKKGASFTLVSDAGSPQMECEHFLGWVPPRFHSHSWLLRSHQSRSWLRCQRRRHLESCARIRASYLH